MRRFTILVLALGLAVPALAQFASPFHVLPAAASTEGGAGTYWKTDLSIYNINEESVLVYAYLIKAGVANIIPELRTYDLAGRSSVHIDDILGDDFGFSGSGGLILSTISITDFLGGQTEGPYVVVTSRTYTDEGDEGTYGQTVSPMVIPAAGSAYLTGIAHDDRYRTNIGVLNLTMSLNIFASTEIHARVYDSAGTHLHTAVFNLQPLSQIQMPVGVSVEEGYVIFEAQGAGADETIFMAYASVVDNLSGDAVFIPASFWVEGAAEWESLRGSGGEGE